MQQGGRDTCRANCLSQPGGQDEFQAGNRPADRRARSIFMLPLAGIGGSGWSGTGRSPPFLGRETGRRGSVGNSAARDGARMAAQLAICQMQVERVGVDEHTGR